MLGLDRVDRARHTLRCEHCNAKGDGACVQCAATGCKRATHAICAQREKQLYVEQDGAHARTRASLLPQHSRIHAPRPRHASSQA